MKDPTTIIVHQLLSHLVGFWTKRWRICMHPDSYSSLSEYLPVI